MHKLIRVMLVLSICWFMVASFISASAVEPLQSPDIDIKRSNEGSSIQVHTFSDKVVVDMVFPRPIMSETRGYDSIDMPYLPKHGAPGKPILPFKTVKVLIPQGKEVQGIDVNHGNRRMLEGKFKLEYGRTPIPISSVSTVVDEPDRTIYESTNQFPSILFSTSEHSLRGYTILVLTLHPVQYIPKIGELFYYPTITVTIDLKGAGKISPLFRDLPQDRTLVQDAVINPQDTETHFKTASMRPTSLNTSVSYHYVIITNNDLNFSFQPLVDWKIQRGLNATTVLVEDILNDPKYFCDGLFGDGCVSEFNGTAARIRNFIKDAYLNWGTEYVLLGGDTEIIPKRGVYDISGGAWVNYDIPCDMYYGALDGSWDNDNDTIFGEGVFNEGPENGTAGDEADFFAEVYIGRATVETPEEATNFVNKTLWYEQASDDSYFRKALMIGETLWEGTEGGNSKDLVTDIIPQYTTTRLYDRDETFSPANVIEELNSGVHIVNHDGHANVDSVMGLSRQDANRLTNDEYFIAYSTGCYAAAFDLDDESIAEHFIFNPHGAFAFIGNSRYGWYDPGTAFDRSFFTILNNGTTNLGKALQLSKENLFDEYVHRWIYFTLNLLGDPEIEIVTEIMSPTAHFETRTDLLDPPVLKGTVDLRGIASRGTVIGATFSNFTIEFGIGTSPVVWVSHGIELVSNGQIEIFDTALATWNTSMVGTSTIYTLRLIVVDVNGSIGEDRWIVRVELPIAIRINPKLVQVRAGEVFIVSCNITDAENLCGLNIRMSWNTTLLDYLNHTVTVPSEYYPSGVLHAPVDITKDEVNQSTGMYWIACVSTGVAFSGNGIAFRMTFRTNINGTCLLNVFSSNLTDENSEPIIHNVVDGIVEVAPGVHNLVITDVVSIKTIVGQGYTTNISVTIENQGSYTESFNVTAYANETAFNNTPVLLTGNKSTTIIFKWGTTGWTRGNYTLRVNTTLVSGETDTADNTLIDGIVTVSIPGDVDGDFDVDLYDAVRIGVAYGAKRGDPRYDLNCDINDNGQIFLYDAVIIGAHYGQKDP